MSFVRIDEPDEEQRNVMEHAMTIIRDKQIPAGDA